MASQEFLHRFSKLNILTIFLFWYSFLKNGSNYKHIRTTFSLLFHFDTDAIRNSDTETD